MRKRLLALVFLSACAPQHQLPDDSSVGSSEGELAIIGDLATTRLASDPERYGVRRGLSFHPRRVDRDSTGVARTRFELSANGVRIIGHHPVVAENDEVPAPSVLPPMPDVAPAILAEDAVARAFPEPSHRIGAKAERFLVPELAPGPVRSRVLRYRLLWIVMEADDDGALVQVDAQAGEVLRVAGQTQAAVGHTKNSGAVAFDTTRRLDGKFELCDPVRRLCTLSAFDTSGNETPTR
jgi:hypothetical protein